MLIEESIRNFMKKYLSCGIYFELKEGEKKGEFVIIERVGGFERNHIKNSSFAIQSYADTLLSAMELNEEVKKVMDKLIEDKRIASVKLNSDYNFTDTSTKKYRYQAVYELVHY